MNARDVAYSGIFIAIIAVSAQISLNIGEVPVTLQVFAVLLTGLLLGAKLGFLTAGLYDVAGAVGLPVFAGFTGGFAHLYGPTGGYLMAFPIASFIAGLFAERFKSPYLWIAGSLVALGVIYLLGWLRLGLYLGGNFAKALYIGVLPFVPLDIAKALIAVGTARAAKRALPWL
ncbi:biotin transporter BioY [Thermococcus sp.]